MCIASLSLSLSLSAFGFVGVTIHMARSVLCVGNEKLHSPLAQIGSSNIVNVKESCFVGISCQGKLLWRPLQVSPVQGSLLQQNIKLF